jgi:hypothetical protein
MAVRKDDGRWSAKGVLLHNLIMNIDLSKGVVVDHKTHNTLDDREENLRIITNADNSANRKGANLNCKTGVRNVHLITKYKGKQEYWVQIMKDGIRYKWEFPIDQFEEACKCAEDKRKELFGEFAGKGKVN